MDLDPAEHLARKNAKAWKEFSAEDKRLEDEGLKALVQTRQGRKYMWRLLRISKAIGVNPYRQNSEDTAFNCGIQNVGQSILAHLMEVAPDAYITMIKEQNDEHRARTISVAERGNAPSLFDADDSDDT